MALCRVKGGRMQNGQLYTGKQKIQSKAKGLELTAEFHVSPHWEAKGFVQEGCTGDGSPKAAEKIGDSSKKGKAKFPSFCSYSLQARALLVGATHLQGTSSLLESESFRHTQTVLNLCAQHFFRKLTPQLAITGESHASKVNGLEVVV